MCKSFYICKESDDGELFTDLEPWGTFEHDEEAPLCGCWYGEEPTEFVHQEEIDELHKWFFEHLLPFLKDDRIGRIVIEVN